MDARILAVAGTAALLALLLYLLAGKPPALEVAEEECLPGNPYRHWAQGSTRSYALMYDKETVKPGEAVHVKIWVLAPTGSERRESMEATLGGTALQKEFELKPRGMYLEACLAVTPRTPGTLTIKWRNTAAEIKVPPLTP